MPLALADLFPDGNFHHQMGFQRGDFAEFFGAKENHAQIVAQRRRWLESDRRKYAVCTPAAAALIDELIGLAVESKTLSEEETTAVAQQTSSELKCLELGKCWESDFLLMQPDRDGQFRLVAGVVCFPSTWSLEEKVGQPLEFIHGPVPALNTQLGRQIGTFLSRLRPGAVWLRTNWGLSASAELNQHPSRAIPAIAPSFDPANTWLRVEHQALIGLPNTNAVLFGIRIANHSLTNVKENPKAADKLANALATMSKELADYKRLTECRVALIQWLRS